MILSFSQVKPKGNATKPIIKLEMVYDSPGCAAVADLTLQSGGPRPTGEARPTAVWVGGC